MNWIKRACALGGTALWRVMSILLSWILTQSAKLHFHSIFSDALSILSGPESSQTVAQLFKKVFTFFFESADYFNQLNMCHWGINRVLSRALTNMTFITK